MTEETAQIETHEEWALRRKRERMVVTRFQGMAALLQADLLESIETYIDESSDPLVKLAWREARFHRLSPMVANIGHQIGLTDEHLDSVFEAARTIAV